MSTPPTLPVFQQNRLLAKLPREELDALRPYFEQVSLSQGQPIILPNQAISAAYFPLTALLSLVTVLDDGSMIEASSIGREGMSGIPVLLDAGITPMQTVVQIPGEAIRISIDVLKAVFDQGGYLYRLLHRYMHTLLVIGSQSIACNRFHDVETRLCRWLLMSSDGTGSETLLLTQEFLSSMLGVRRAGVTNAAVKLQDAGLIQYHRGRIQLLDRARLEACACECYRVTRNEFDRLVGAEWSDPFAR